MKKIAVHGANSMARRWPSLIRARGLECRIVDGYSNTIMDELREFDALLWHVNQDNVTDLRFARSVLLAAAELGLRVYPNHASVWHFDDKVAQKYLLDAIGAPLARTWVFFERSAAQEFIDQAAYPIVFKLRRGAGSLNVRLLRNRREAMKMLNLMFGRGVTPFPTARSLQDAATRVRRNKRDLGWLLRNCRRVGSLLLQRQRQHDSERGYVLLQEYIEGNDHDTRIVVIGGRAFAWRRRVRPGDFRASGFGQNTFLDPGDIDERLVRIGFDIASDLRTQSLALDFVYDPHSHEPVLLEISFGTIPELVDACKGFFDDNLTWHPGSFDMAELVLRDLLVDDASDKARGAGD